MRHEHQLQVTLNKKVVVHVADDNGGAETVVTLPIVPDEDAPYATLTARSGRERGNNH